MYFTECNLVSLKSLFIGFFKLCIISMSPFQCCDNWGKLLCLILCTTLMKLGTVYQAPPLSKEGNELKFSDVT